MTCATPPRTPQHWFAHLFNAKAARDGAVIRRKIRDMERMVGRDVFAAEIRRRGFTAVENAGQVVVFCNAEPVRLIAGPPPKPDPRLPSNPSKDLTTDFR